MKTNEEETREDILKTINETNDKNKFHHLNTSDLHTNAFVKHAINSEAFIIVIIRAPHIGYLSHSFSPAHARLVRTARRLLFPHRVNPSSPEGTSFPPVRKVYFIHYYTPS